MERCGVVTLPESRVESARIELRRTAAASNDALARTHGPAHQPCAAARAARRQCI